MPDKVRVGAVDEFEDGAVYSFDIHGEDVAVVRFRGRFYAFENKCTHWGVALTEGYVNSAGNIVCMYHDSAFDMRTGATADGPAYDDLRLFHVEVEGEEVFVSN